MFTTEGNTPIVAFRNLTANQLVVVLVNPKEKKVVDAVIKCCGFRLEGIEIFRTSTEENNKDTALTLEARTTLKFALVPKSINTLRASFAPDLP